MLSVFFKFCHVLSNIHKLIDIKKANVTIRMNVDKTNSNEFVELYKFLKLEFGGKINFYPAFVHDYHDKCKSISCYENNVEKSNFISEIYHKHDIYQNSIYPKPTNKGCMMQQLNSFLVGLKGELYKCWHHLGNQEKEIGNIFEKNIITNPNNLAKYMIEGDILHNDECNRCVLFPVCNGGCADINMQYGKTCIPMKSDLENFIEMHYNMKTKINEV